MTEVGAGSTVGVMHHVPHKFSVQNYTDYITHHLSQHFKFSKMKAQSCIKSAEIFKESQSM